MKSSCLKMFMSELINFSIFTKFNLALEDQPRWISPRSVSQAAVGGGHSHWE
ncbi:hypothetical protein DSUL_60043 [Desulfovibrionales bacterium]